MHCRVRSFIVRSALLGALACAAPALATVGQVFPSERVVVNDAVTGVPMTVLTNGKQSDAKIYQTHPQWTSDGAWIVFRTSGRGEGSQAYAVHETDGTIVQLTEGPGTGTGSLCVAKKSMRLFYWRTTTIDADGAPSTAPTTAPTTAPALSEALSSLIELDLGKLLADAKANAVKERGAYERTVATLPRGTRDGGQLAIDADESAAYFSIRGGDLGQHLAPGTEIWQKREGDRMGTGPGGLRAVDLKTGALTVIADVPFQVGHVQSNPWVSGEIVFCHETGGDAPQRIWTVRADGTGLRPLFEEGPLDWVTHEAFVTKDEVMFNLIGHQPRLRVRPTGIAVVNLRTNAITLLGQIDEPSPAENPTSLGGFWHCNGSPDGRWAAGDTFDGNLWLIDRTTGQRRLLSTDHKMKPDHAHPTFSDDSQRVLIQSGHFTEGQRLQLIVLPVKSSNE